MLRIAAKLIAIAAGAWAGAWLCHGFAEWRHPNAGPAAGVFDVWGLTLAFAPVSAFIGAVAAECMFRSVWPKPTRDTASAYPVRPVRS